MSQSDEEETSEFGSYVIDPETFGNEHSVLASKLAILAGHASVAEGSSDEQISVEALLEAAGIRNQPTRDGKSLTDPKVLKRLSSSVSCALDEAAAALSKMKSETETSIEQSQERTLVEACNDGDVQAVRKLLFEGHDANETTPDGESLLSMACSSGFYELAEILLFISSCSRELNLSSSDHEQKFNSDFFSMLNHQLAKVLLTMHANVEDCGAKGECTPLMEAASAGYADIVRLLLSHGADVNARSNTGNTALTYACCGGYEEIVRILVENGAELECHNENGHTPLMEAASGGHVPVAAILLQHGAGINTHSNEFKESALTLACYKGHLHMVRFLLQAGADQEHKTDEMHTALMEASMDGHVEVARLLLDSGAQVNMPADSFESPLTLAACGGHVELADLLIQRGAAIEEVNDEGYTPLMEAAREGHEEMVKLLLEKGAKVNAKTEETQETALTLACCGGFMECVEVMLKAGADLEAGCSTPIMEAAQEGHLELVQYLVEKGANIHATTSSGDTALSFACEHGQTKVVEYLVDQGAELEHETDGGRTPLMKAARGGHLSTVQYLIYKGADVNRATKNNEHTVLSLACACGHLPVVETLLCSGADPTFKLKDGSNLLLEASKGGHTSIVQFLLDMPNRFLSTSAETTQTSLSNNEPLPNRVPTQSLPMVVPAHEPDQGPISPASNADSFNSSNLFHVANHLEAKISQENEKAASQLQALWQQQMQYYPQPNPALMPSESSLSTSALMNHIVQQGGFGVPPSDPTCQTDSKLMDKDVTGTVESFLLSMAQDAAGEGRRQCEDALDAEGREKLRVLEQRIKVAIENNTHLKNSDMLQSHQLTRAEDVCKIREDQIYKKQKILEELQKVERALQLKTQQQLKEQYLERRQNEIGMSSQRGKPDGESVDDVDVSTNDNILPLKFKPDTSTTKPDSLIPLPPDSKIPAGYRVEENVVSHFEQALQAGNEQPNLPPNALQLWKNMSPNTAVIKRKLSNSSQQQEEEEDSENVSHRYLTGASGSFPQPIKSIGDPFSLSNPPCKNFIPPSLNSYPNMEIESHTESNHDTPLTLASAGGHDELVRLLISRGANIEHRDKKGFTPLILASTAGHANVVATLLDANSDIEALSDRTKDTPLSLACSGGRLEAAEILLQRGANREHRNVSDYTPLSLAASGGFVSVVKLLLHHGAEINSRTGSKLGISPLMLAAMNGHYETVQLLLDMGADINAQIETNRNTALTLACFQGRHNVVSLLVDRKANVEHRAKTGLTPLMEAASGGYAEVGRVLLDKGADPNAPPVPSSRDTALTIAADKGHYKFCELVLSRGAQVEVKNKKGNTPLWLSCNGGHLDVVMLLVGKGALVNATDNRGVTPLMAGFRKGHVQVVRWLAKEVSQYPSDTECLRYIATVSDKELLKRTQQCMECIVQAKELQAQEANKFASELLEELDNEKNLKKARKMKHSKRRKKRRRRKQNARWMANQDEDEDDEDEDDDEGEDEEKPKEETIPHLINEPSRIASSQVLEIVSSVKKLTIEERRLPPVTTTTIISLLTPSTTSYSSATFSSVVTTCSVATSHAKPIASASATPIAKTSPETQLFPLPVPVIEETRAVVKQRPKSPEIKKKPSPVSSLSHENHLTSSSSGDSSPRLSGRKVRKPVAAVQKTTPVREQASSRPAPRVSSATYSSSSSTRQSKRTSRRDEGWKEVTKKYGASSGVKRIMIASNLISRVIGRGGCNINAIREVTGAHIDIDKLRKGTIERTVTIKGSNEAIRHAQSLITALIKEEKTEQEIAEFIAKTRAQAAELRAAQNKPPPPKPTLTIVAAPLPSKPAWTVPPSIVSHSARNQSSSQTTTTTSTFTVGVWAPSTTEVSSTTTVTTSTLSKWQTIHTVAQTTSNTPSVETVKKALFHSTQPATTATTTVTFSRQSDKPVTKPVQPVAPMVAAKTTSTPVTRILPLSYGPIGSGIPSRNQQPIHRPNSSIESIPGSPDPVREHGHANLPMSIQFNGPTPMVLHPHVIPRTSEHDQNFVTASFKIPICHSCTAMHQEMLQSNRTSISNSATGGMGSSEGTPRSSIEITPVRGNYSDVARDTEVHPQASTVPPQTYSPFSSSFTPAGSSALWNNGSATGSQYKGQTATSTEDHQIDSDISHSMTDESKAPGYRGNAKSPNIDPSLTGTPNSNPSNNEATSVSSTGSQQSSPSADTEASAKPRPIGTERAQLQRKTNNAIPLTTDNSLSTSHIWSYDKLTPVQLGMESSIDSGKYNNWSGVIGQVRSDGIITTATSSKPQVTPSEVSASPKPLSMETHLQNPRVPTAINQLYAHGTPHLLYGNHNRLQSSAGRFSQQPTNNTRTPGTQPPIGTQLGGSSGLNMLGMQQQQPQHSTLQPIGSHLGGAGHLRSNLSYQSPIQRSLNTNPGHPQPASQNHRYQLPYYHADLTWQQQQQPLYNPQSRHPPMNPYPQREPQHPNPMYGSLHSHYPSNIPGNNLNQNQVIPGYSNPPMPDVNTAYQIHHDTQAPYMRDGGQFYDGNNEFMVRNMVANNYGTQHADSNPTWDPTMCRPGFQTMNGVPDVQSVMRTQHGFEMESHQNFKEW